MEGGVKTKKSTNKKDPFKMSDMNKALKDLFGDTMMDTDVKKKRKTVTQPRREPSARVKSIVKKALEPKKLTVVPKKVNKRPVTTAVARHPVSSVYVDDNIIKRHTSQDISYGRKQDYIDEFNDLFRRYLPELKASIHNDAMNDGEHISDNTVAINIVQLTDDLYFTIRDELIKGVRSRSF